MEPGLYEFLWGPTEFQATGTLKNYDISSRLGAIKIPSLMVCGEFDEAAPKTCKLFAEMIEKNLTVIIPDAGHATMAENKMLYLKTVRDFIKQAGL